MCVSKNNWTFLSPDSCGKKSLGENAWADLPSSTTWKDQTYDSIFVDQRPSFLTFQGNVSSLTLFLQGWLSSRVPAELKCYGIFTCFFSWERSPHTRGYFTDPLPGTKHNVSPLLLTRGECHRMQGPPRGPKSLPFVYGFSFSHSFKQWSSFSCLLLFFF